MKKINLLIIGFLCAAQTMAQSTIKGKIINATTQEALSGATVSVDGKLGTTANASGEFSLACKDSIALQISFVGFETKVEKVACGSTVTISLQPTTTELSELEITATSNPNKSQLEQAASIVKMKELEIKRSTGIYMYDAINTNIPGVSMTSRSNSGGQQISIRGYGNGMGIRGVNSNFDSQGIKMYLNGIPITDAEGITVMDDIDFGSISNVEVSKGPSGTLYGLAIAGVVNLQTQKAEKDDVSVGQDVMAGSYGLIRITTRMAIGGQHSSLLINYGHQQFDGFMPHTASQKDFVNMMGEFRVSDKQTVSTYIGLADSYDERNGELTVAQYDTMDYSGNPAYIKNDAHSAIRSVRAGISTTYNICKTFSNTTSVFGSGQSFDNSSAGGWTDKTPVNYGFRSVFENLFHLTDNIKLSGITGIEMQKMSAQTIGYGMGADSTNLDGYNIITSIRSNQANTTSTYNYFTQWTLALPMGFSVNAGVGVSNMSIELQDRLWGLNNNKPTATKSPSFAAQYNNLVSPSFSVNKKIGKSMSAYASYSTGYKAPVGSNIVISTTGQVNDTLKPEYGVQLEMGTKGSVLNNKLFYTVAVFNAKFQDKFTTFTVQNPANTATLYSYIVNGGSLNNTGVEVLVKYTVIESATGFVSHVRPFANLTYSDFKYDNFEYRRIVKDANAKDSTAIDNYSGNAVAGVAPVVFNAGVDVDTKIGLYGNVTYNYKSAMPFTSDGLNETVAYSLLNAKIGYKHNFKGLTVDAYVGANNITGTQYYNMVFVNQMPDAYIPGPNEINFFGGLNLKYTF